MNPNIKEWVSEVYLEPIEHVYIHRETNVRYKSVTTVLSLVEPHFDSDGVASAITKQSDEKKNPLYVGMNKDQILDYWQQLNDTANEYGTFVHNTIEKYLFKHKLWFPETELEQKIIAGYESLNIDEGIMMYPERIMFASEYSLAGMSDLVIDLKGDAFILGDWKTNREFGYWNKYGFETLLAPVSHLQNCQYSIYSLQLSIYAYMYELETGKKCRNIFIGYWDKVAETMSRIPVIYLKTEAKKVMDLYKYKMLLS